MARLQPALFPEIEGPDFIRDQAIETVGQAVLSQHGKVGGPLFEVARAIRDEEIRILWLRNDKPYDPEKDDEGHDVVGKCVKAVAAAKHDVEDFVAVMRLYGPIVGDSARYVRAATRSVAPTSDIACVGSNHVPGCEHTGGDVPKRGES